MKGLLAAAGISVGLSAWVPGAALAHGDLHEQIEALTRQIEKEPRQAELYLRRGELHRAHTDWDAAQADYDRAVELDSGLKGVDLARGRMFLEANWPRSAKVALDRFLARYPDHVEGRIQRARALVRLEQRLAAVKDYTHALAKSTEPRPELYLERAQALMAEGNSYFPEALQGLDEGIQRLGPLVTLELYAIDLELKQRRHDAALKRLDRLAAQSKRQETWLARRGEILRDAGRPEEARRAWEASLAEMAKLPPARRNVPAMMELEKRVRAALEAMPPGVKVRAVSSPEAPASSK